jgi:hypothetical protein
VDAKQIVKNRIYCYVCNSDSKGEADCSENDLDKLRPFNKVFADKYREMKLNNISFRVARH